MFRCVQKIIWVEDNYKQRELLLSVAGKIFAVLGASPRLGSECSGAAFDRIQGMCVIAGQLPTARCLKRMLLPSCCSSAFGPNPWQHLGQAIRFN